MEEKKILIIDDEPDLVKMLSSRLESNGYKTISASTGVEGLQKAKEEHPDLILLDIMLPQLSGVTIALWLKESEETKSIPIIVITVVEKDELSLLFRRIEVSDYISKPFDVEELLCKIKNAIKKE